MSVQIPNLETYSAGEKAPDPVFLVVAHTDPPMLARLIRRLAPFRVIVHLDLKSNSADFAALRETHAEMTAERVAVSWAGFSQIEAIRILLRHVADAPPLTPLVLLTGQDYPARDPKDFAKLLSQNPGRQYIASFPVLDGGAKYLRQIRHRHYRDALPHAGPQMRRVVLKLLELSTIAIPHSAPEGLEILHGQANWVLTNECAQEVAFDASPPVNKFFRKTFASDEKYFHTLVARSRHSGQLGDEAHQAFSGPGNWRYTNFHYIRADLGELTIADFPDVVSSGKYFARKVTSRGSGELLEKLDGRLG